MSSDVADAKVWIVEYSIFILHLFHQRFETSNKMFLKCGNIAWVWK